MSHPHTLAHWRELWLPQVFDRQRLDPWQERGAKDVNARLRELTITLMDEHEVDPLPEAVEAELEAILRGARAGSYPQHSH
jgi:trimethylamine--corrinoid protein Co-methyltransferase